MEIKRLTAANLKDDAALSRSDERENIKRECFRGLIAYEQGAAKGSILWGVRTEERDRASEEISFFSAVDETAAEGLLKRHDELLEEEGIEQSYIEAGELPDSILKSLAEADFSLTNGESRDLLLTVEQLSAMKYRRQKLPRYILNIGKLEEMELWNGLTNCLYSGRKGLIEDMDSIPETWFEPDVSCCVRTDQWVEGLLLVHKTLSGILMPVLFFCSGRDQKINLFYMMCYTIQAVQKKYSPETQILVRRHNESTKKLTDYLFPGITGREVIRGERK